MALLAVLLTTLGVPAATADNAASEPGPPVAGPIVFVRDGVIHTINPDGSGERLLREGANPELSPDGSRVAFGHPGPTGTRNIWEMNADGSGGHRCTPVSTTTWRRRGRPTAHASSSRPTNRTPTY